MEPTVFTSAHQLSLSWARSIQSMSPSHFQKTHFNSILPSVHGSSKWFFPSGFPTKILHTPPLSPYVLHAPSPIILLDSVTQIVFDGEYRPLSSSLCSFLHSPVTSSYLGPNILLSSPILKALSLVPFFYTLSNRTFWSSISLCEIRIEFWYTM